MTDYALRILRDGTASWALKDKKYGNDFAHKATIETLTPRIPSGLLPPVPRYISPQRNIVAFDRPPTKVTVNYYGKQLKDIEDATMLQEYEIWLPWTGYVMLGHKGVLSSIYLFALRGPLSSIEDPLYLLPLPNYYASGQFCIPPHTEYNFESIADAMNLTWDLIWSSNFNKDITECVDLAYNVKAPTGLFERLDPRSLKRRSAADLFVTWSKMEREEVTNLEWMTSDKMETLPSLFNMASINPTNFITQTAAELRY